MPDRVFADAEGDRDRRGRSFGCKRSRIAGCSDNGHATADEVSHERRQAIVLAAEPMVLDHHVLTLDVAGFAEAFTERGCMARGPIERPAADKADHRHGRLLRARRKRPCGCHAAKKRDELAAFHGSMPPCLNKKDSTPGGAAAVRDFGPVFVRYGSFASDRNASALAACPLRPSKR